MTYDEALHAINGLQPRGWRLDLDRISRFVELAGLSDAVGRPGGPQFLHVTGTNGKGSVTAYLQSLLVEQGYRTGAFYSPFVFDPRERWQFGRDLIDPQELANLTEELWPLGDSFTETPLGGFSEFEFKTGLGFLYFKRKRCDWVAMEVGLGGRLDATNVITPRASGIVSIGLDHTSILGETKALIAGEKAGIVKDGVPVVAGEMDGDALAVITAAAQERQAPLWRVGLEVVYQEGEAGTWNVSTPVRTYQGLRPGIFGRHQPHNVAVAIGMLDASGAVQDADKVAEGIARATVPGRMQRLRARDRDWILDGAHNADAALSLRDSLVQAGIQEVVLLTGMVMGHDPVDFYRTLQGLTDTAVLAPIDFHRAVPPRDLAEKLGTSIPNLVVANDLEAAIQEAVARAEGRPIVVTGSFYLVGEVGRALGLN